ncbi:MAG: Dyp-type peroxidase [Acidimicrobiales bacterium]|nr:Dyp-type peroxidase [Acidimicrobiales bacterium]
MDHRSAQDDAPRIGRRQLLGGVGGAAAALTVGLGSAGRRTRTVQAEALAAADDTEPVLALDRIQGNVVAGFRQHLQALVLLTVPDAAAGRAWLSAVAPTVVSSAAVAEHNAAWSAAVDAGDPPPKATFLNVALTHAGLAALGRPRDELRTFPRAFREGMAARARRVGDTDDSAPSTWPAPYRTRAHAMVVLAADERDDLDAAVARQRAIATDAGVAVVHVEQGEARADEPGHEHFGFRDGVSQPGLRGFTAAENPDDPDQGVPGQDLLWPGEFVLGYPRQAGVGGGEDAGPVARSGPDWTTDGSYLVYRRLRQDVAGFHAFIERVADEQGITTDLAGAKIVGRYRSGAPLGATGAVDTDPGADDPVCEPHQINDFEFGEDLDGAVVPLAAHIRKTYSRDHPTDAGGEEDAQLHRLLRRGIPYGASYVAGESDPDAAFPDDRGLLFLAYQWSIEQQFEHVQRRFVNDPDFPEPGAGQDPVIAQSPATGSFTLPGGRTDHVALMQRFVLTTGGDYFFSPSIPALGQLAQAPPQEAPATGGGRRRGDGDRRARDRSRPRGRQG